MAKTINEIREHFEEQEQNPSKAKQLELFEKASKALQLLDLTKNENRTYNTYSKDRLRSFMKNPFANASNLRLLSQFLYRMSYPYRRLVQYNAQMIDLTALSVIPNIDFNSKTNTKKVLKNYYNTLKKIKQMRLEKEILKLLIVAWREDAVFGYIYDDDKDFYIQLLDGQYCKISSVEGGKINFAFDFNYFKSHAADLEYWDSEFQTKYNQADKDSKMRWQELDPARTICLKINSDDLKLSLPPFVSLFEQIIDLIDLQALQNVKDELNIYKLLVARMETINNSGLPDDFTVDPDTAIEYFNLLEDRLPASVSAIISPLKIEPIEFKGDTTEDVDMISNSMKNLFKNSGGSQILNNDNASGTTAFTAMIETDTMMAIKPLLPQIETWMNYYLTATIGADHAYVKYLEVSYLTKQEKKKELLESAQYGVPVKLAVASLDGYSPIDTLALQFLENDMLSLHDKWIPLQSSHTLSNNDTDPVKGGRPKQDNLTEEGEKTREQNKNDK